MRDLIPAGTGDSRYLKSVADFLSRYPTYEDMAAALVAGTLPIDLNGINPDGVTQAGTALNKANLLTDDTAAMFELDASSTPNDCFSAIGSVLFWRASPVLDENPWGVIRMVSDEGTGADYWEVGDCKEVTLNGVVGSCVFSNYTTYAFIIGFNHNAVREGDNRIHFQLGKTAASGGTDICFVDSYCGSSVVSDDAFHMNKSNVNTGGWASSYMRNIICGTDLSNYSGTFISALPGALRTVLKTVTKYTDNTGNGSTEESAVTATTDVIFLLSEKEVYGSIKYANTNEGTYQEQYAYYAAGNSRAKYRYDAQETYQSWWLRSPCDTREFVIAFYYSVGANVRISGGFAPCLCV